MGLFLKVVRDPIWQAVGVVVGIIAMLLTFSQASVTTGELAIVKYTSIGFENYLLPSNSIRLQLKNTGQGLNDAVVDYYLIANKGVRPILPLDFSSPLAIKSKVIGQILFVSSCEKPASLENTGASENGDLMVQSVWDSKNLGWSAKPVLLNPEEYLCVLVFRKPTEDGGDVKLDWFGRVAGSKLVVYKTKDDYRASLKKDPSYYIQTSIHLDGFGAYWFAGLQIAIFYATLLLAGQARKLSQNFRVDIWKIVIFMILSTCTAEILVDIFINKNWHNLSPVVWPLLTGQIVVFVYLFIKALDKKPSS